MNYDDKTLAMMFHPYFKTDEAEPFDIRGIGYSVYFYPQQSRSCKRFLDFDVKKVYCIIEYAIFYDFDIQHLYDLEHCFVFVDYGGRVIDVEASFHGWFFKSMINQELEFITDTHPVLYVQPGKHAMMPQAKYFELYRQYETACYELAGKDGFLIAPMFQQRFTTNEKINQQVKDFIRKNYSFHPSKKYQLDDFRDIWLISYERLEDLILDDMKMWIKKITGTNM